MLRRKCSAELLRSVSSTIGWHLLRSVFSVDLPAGRAEFAPLPSPSDSDVKQLVETVANRAIGALIRKGLLSPDDQTFNQPDPLALEEPATAACYSAAIQGRFAFGEKTGQPLPRIGADPRASFDQTQRPLQARDRGFDLHAAVSIPDGQRDRLERVCRYLCRPPLAHDRLALRDDGRVALELKTPYSDGTTHILLTPDALFERLAALVPRPRTHRIRYHGVLAPSSHARPFVIPMPPKPPSEAPSTSPPDSSSAQPPSDRTRFRWILWATLMKRVLEIDCLKCPKCSGRMVPIAAILRADVVAAILECLGLPVDAPPIRPARPPPDPGLVEFDLT